MLDLARGLASRGHRVTVISLAEGGALRGAFAPITVETVARRRDGIDPTLVVRLAARLAALSVDVVHTHNPLALSYGAPAARLARVPRVVHTKHGANPSERRRTVGARRLLARLCDAFVAVSPETAEVARVLDRVREPRLVTIANGIDVGAFARDPAARARVRAELGVGDACLVGTVARLAPEKNHVGLVAAMAPLLGPSVHLAIVGDGPERAAIERAIAPALRPFVHLTGARHDVPALLSAFDLFALSSTTEGLPLAVPEAMAAGLPVVATAVGGLPSVLREGITGLLVPAGDEAALGRALGALIADPARRERLGRAARDDAAARFSLARVVDAYEALYAASTRGASRSGSTSQSGETA